MSLKCSVFGHRFGDTDVTREREEQGSEVVITITEAEACKRCGETRIVSENTEVTTLETPSDIVRGDDQQTGEGDTGDDPSTTGPETGRNESGTPDPGGGGSTRTDGTDRADREGEGPTVTAVETAEEDDGIILEDDSEERPAGQWPQETDEEPGEEWTPETNPGELRPVEEEQPGIERMGEAITVPEGEFHCPECGFSTAVESSSLREGDFCPECHRGSLTHLAEE
jgi:hypothetical protein